MKESEGAQRKKGKAKIKNAAGEVIRLGVSFGVGLVWRAGVWGALSVATTHAPACPEPVEGRQAVGGFPFESERKMCSVPAAQVVLALHGRGREQFHPKS